MIIVFPFIVLKYFSFCCHSSHSVLCCNRLSYSYFILIVKSDSKFNLNFSCYLSFLLICLLPISVYSLFFIFLTLLFLFQIVFFYAFCLSCYSVFFHFVFPLILSLLLLCLSSFCFSCYSVFLLILSLCHSVSCHSVSFHLFVALPFPFFPLTFSYLFTLSSVYFLIFLREYLSI